MREMQIFDYKKKIAEAETKLKQQQVWSKRLSYSYNVFRLTLGVFRIFRSKEIRKNKNLRSSKLNSRQTFYYLQVYLTYFYKKSARLD